MRRLWPLFAITFSIASAVAASTGTADLAWAFPAGRQSLFGRPTPRGPFHVPGSRLTVSLARLKSDEGPVDWFPDDHPPAPDIVAKGGHGRPTPCAECHLHNGAGFPAAPDLAGLPAAYIVAQVHAFREGTRRSAKTDQPDTDEMIAVARSVSPADLAKAAAYYSGLPRGAWVKVVETRRAPRTIPDHYGWLDPAPGGGTEPIGDRVIELSNHIERAMLHDDHVGITDYVPPGAIARGARIVAHAAQPCTNCHGADLEGAGAAPPLAGRPAAYLARQIWNFRTGARHDPAAALMKAPAAALSPGDIVAVTAYLAAHRR